MKQVEERQCWTEIDNHGWVQLTASECIGSAGATLNTRITAGEDYGVYIRTEYTSAATASTSFHVADISFEVFDALARTLGYSTERESEMRATYVALTTTGNDWDVVLVGNQGEDKDSVSDRASRAICGDQWDQSKDILVDTQIKNLTVVSRTQTQRRFPTAWRRYNEQEG